MKVLVVGGGAREHALAWKLFSSSAVREVYCAPGNAGTAIIAHSVPVRHDDIPNLADWAKTQRIDLTVVGPEGPLGLGIVDHFAAHGLVCIGPTREAAEIETSKVWAKALIARHGIPTGRAEVAESPAAALELARKLGYPVAIKADGLAAGKGVVVAQDESQARGVLQDFMVDKTLGAAGARVLVEEFLDGEEASVLAFSDGRDLAVMPPARDYKRVGDGDSGPNTGGMGAYAPAPSLDARTLTEVRERILAPAIAAMAAEGRPFKGVLYAGLMLTADGPKVLEFNCRFGDPEAQAILPLLESDLVEVLLAIDRGALGAMRVEWSPTLATCVVVAASAGYPGKVKVGLPIRGLDSVESGAIVFHGATRRDRSGRNVVTSGGRVVSVVGRGRDLQQARSQAYRGIGEIGFEGMQYRRDIGAEPVAARLLPALAASGSPPAAVAPAAAPSGAVVEGPEALVSSLSASLSTAFAALGAPGSGGESAPPAAVTVGVIGADAADGALVDIVRAACAAGGVECDLATVSPYRAPEELRRWAEGAPGRGARVLVAIGGSAPHLPGLLAAMTPLPVIAVGTRSANVSSAEAVAALLALPPGVALAVAGLDEGGARNAAALALAILALADPARTARYLEARAAVART